MANTPEGRLKAKATIIAERGPNYWAEIGAKGGKKSKRGKKQ